jgi:hypothetical protein
MITNRLKDFLNEFYRLNGYVPTRLILHRSDVLVLCWENEIPANTPPGMSHTFMGIQVGQKFDA